MTDFRTFFFSLFAESRAKRRKFIKNWYNQYPVNKKQHTCVADVYYEFITLVLYEPIHFRVHTDHFLLLGDASKSLGVRYEWLDANERRFLEDKVFKEREALFKTCVVGVNCHMHLDGFKYDPVSKILSPVKHSVDLSESHTGIFSFVWQREIVRDFVWFVLNNAKKERHLYNQLILALRRINDEHMYGKRDMFIASLLQGIYGQIDVHRVPCWGFTPADIHPENAYQREKFAITTTIY